MWACISSVITTGGAFILFLYPGIISLETLVFCVVITFGLALMFLFQRDEGIF